MRTLPRLEFSAGGKLNGFTGCNMMSGAYRVEEGRVRLGPLDLFVPALLKPAAQRWRVALGAVMFFAVTGRNPPDAIARMKGDSLDILLTPALPQYGQDLVDAIAWAMRLEKIVSW